MWYAVDADGMEVAGSADPAREIIRAHKEGRVTLLGEGVPELIVER